MRECSECSRPIGRGFTCSPSCRQRRRRRLLAESIGRLTHKVGTVIVLGDEARTSLASSLRGDAAFAPDGITPARWEAITSGRIRVLSSREISTICCWHPHILRILRLPAGLPDEGEWDDMPREVGGIRVG